MPSSLKTKLSKLRYKGKITNEEYQEIIKKLDGHDARARAAERDKTIDEAREALIRMKKSCDANGHDCDRCEYTHHSYHQNCADYVLEQMKEGGENG